MVNRHRGEVEAVLDGRTWTLCLTLGALAELEAALAAGDLMGLARRFEAGASPPATRSASLARVSAAPATTSTTKWWRGCAPKAAPPASSRSSANCSPRPSAGGERVSEAIPVIPAEAGIHSARRDRCRPGNRPGFAGVTASCRVREGRRATGDGRAFPGGRRWRSASAGCACRARTSGR